MLVVEENMETPWPIKNNINTLDGIGKQDVNMGNIAKKRILGSWNMLVVQSGI